MNFGEILIGLGAVVAGVLALWLALPREGQVRAWLRSDASQAMYAVFILSLFAFGLVYIVTGAVP